MKIRNILFATDFSECSDMAADYALELATQYKAKVYVIHVIYDIEKGAGWYVSHINTAELYEEMLKSANTEIERVVRERFGGYGDVETLTIKGVPYEEIIAFAREKDIDLLVIGSHGRKGLDRVIFGSTASKVVKNAGCPVLTVRCAAGA